MLTVNPKKPLELYVVEVLRAIDVVTKEIGMAYVLVGATARDVIMYHVFGHKPSRASRDVDFALLVDGWDLFEELKNRLVSSGQFSSEKNSAQRMFYRQMATGYQFMVDLIPFGGVENEAHQLVWPPDMSIVMTVAGFADVLGVSSKVQVESDLIINVASLAGLSLLKLMAWVDRRDSSEKDASDLVDLLRSYEHMGNQDRIYTEALTILEKVDHDPQLSGAWLLGQDAALVATEDTRERVLAVLSDNDQMERLNYDMAKALRGYTDGFERATQLISLYKEGFTS